MVHPDELILSGGNFGSICFIGCIKKLMDSDELDLKKIKRWVGTSGGAVMSFLLAIGYDPIRIMNILKEIDISKLSPITSEKWLSFFDNYGLHDTTRFRIIFCEMLKEQEYSESTTFIDFYTKTGIDLNFTTYCLNSKELLLLNYETYPDMKLLDGLCMSIAVPFLFYPVKYKNEFYVDALLVCVQPVEYSSSENSLSIALSFPEKYVDTIDLLSYIKIVTQSSMLKVQELLVNNYKGRAIKIECDYEFGTCFDFSDETLKKFYNVGYNT
tara:strand:+ start:2210 stop:3019 length:810 start_codon:yes stop_codon:yes gene_type:complete